MERDRFERSLRARGIILEPAELTAVFDGPIRKLFTPPPANPKTAKGLKYRYSTLGLALAPALTSGFQTCPKATAGCAAACLNTAGRGGFDAAIPRARKRRTWQFIARREEFMTQAAREIAAHVKACKRKGYRPAVRLNVVSDIQWERIPVTHDGRTYSSLMAAFPRVQFYDYTKIVARLESDLPRNYHLTFSAAESNGADTARALQAGASVAMVFRSLEVMSQARGRSEAARARSAGILMRRMELPAEYGGRTVVDGDLSDLRFKDPAGSIVALRAKGLAVADASGFVRDLP